MPFEPQVEILPDPEALALRVAEWLVEAAKASNGAFAVALSGGSTPKRLYEILASPPLLGDFPWARAHWFWGDEKFVPPDNADSNYRMTREAMLSRAPIPEKNIHPVPTVGMTPEAAAVAYERELKAFYGSDRLDPARPLFDVTLLGLGEDGHTASLFPGVRALDERDHWVAPVVGAKSEARITLTLPAIDSSRRVAFLVAGESKHDILARLRGGEALAASQVRPVGTLHLFADMAAAGRAL